MLNWRFIVAVLLIAGSLILAIGGHTTVKTALLLLEQKASEAEAEGLADESVDQMLALWEQQKNKLTFFIEHAYLQTLDDAFIDLKSAQKNSDMQEIEKAMNRIGFLSKQLLESEKFTLFNFF